MEGCTSPVALALLGFPQSWIHTSPMHEHTGFSPTLITRVSIDIHQIRRGNR